MNSKLGVTVSMDMSELAAAEAPSSSIFGTFRRWPLVSSFELCLLQAALTQCVELAGPESAHELLTDVAVELERRTAETPPLPG
ncbi:hypothetical protein J2W14_000680 [Pseudarthrobacter oxydans]|uniref:hypothetical protein n=1 Tax=Pseudarthrobacter oxydans TaxID=1671 RepID=UPI00278312CE|nr:hypothetical protein [Pseudarthrobacter oxydans]MDP9981300.1 hypothetical protein [Pseudarthrobacter oxydans]